MLCEQNYFCIVMLSVTSFVKQSSGLDIIAGDCSATSDLSVGKPSAYMLKHTIVVQSCLIASTAVIT